MFAVALLPGPAWLFDRMWGLLMGSWAPGTVQHPSGAPDLPIVTDMCTWPHHVPWHISPRPRPPALC